MDGRTAPHTEAMEDRGGGGGGGGGERRFEIGSTTTTTTTTGIFNCLQKLSSHVRFP